MFQSHKYIGSVTIETDGYDDDDDDDDGICLVTNSLAQAGILNSANIFWPELSHHVYKIS